MKGAGAALLGGKFEIRSTKFETNSNRWEIGGWGATLYVGSDSGAGMGFEQEETAETEETEGMNGE